MCDRLGIKELYHVSFQKEYWSRVFTPFLEEYSTALETPNPDVGCNRHIKFDVLRQYVNEKIGL